MTGGCGEDDLQDGCQSSAVVTLSYEVRSAAWLCSTEHSHQLKPRRGEHKKLVRPSSPRLGQRALGRDRHRHVSPPSAAGPRHSDPGAIVAVAFMCASGKGGVRHPQPAKIDVTGKFLYIVCCTQSGHLRRKVGFHEKNLSSCGGHHMDTLLTSRKLSYHTNVQKSSTTACGLVLSTK